MRRSDLMLAALLLPTLAIACAPVALAAPAPGIPRAGVTVALRALADIGSGDIRLGDIADVGGGDTDLASRVRNLCLPGSLTRERRLSRPELAHWIRAQTGLATNEVAWSGAVTVQLRRGSQQVSGEQLVAAARDQLAHALAPLKGRIVIESVAGGAKIELPAGRMQFRPRALPGAIAPAKHMFVWVDVMAGDRFVRAVPVSFEVSIFVTGWALTRPAMAGSRIAIDAVEPHEVDLTAADVAGDLVRRQEDTFKSPSDVVLLRGDLHPGDVLTWKNAVPAPMVTRGVPAMLRMHSEAIEVESRVLVLQDGFLGQTVKVRASGATGAVVATVTGSGMVEAQK